MRIIVLLCVAVGFVYVLNAYDREFTAAPSAEARGPDLGAGTPISITDAAKHGITLMKICVNGVVFVASPRGGVAQVINENNTPMVCQTN